MTDLLLKASLAYLIGNIMGGPLLGLLRGVDLRKLGSGNVGATNALRTQGKGFALGVLAIDVLKGVLAVLVVPRLPDFGETMLGAQELAFVCGLAVALGHCYPVLYRFRGGKGVATLAGVFGVLLAPALAWMLSTFVLVVLLSGYVSLATLSATLTAILWVAVLQGGGLASPAGAFTLAMAALVTWKHRDNIGRLLHGEEHRFEKARVLGRWLRR